ncbi:TIGR04438 family Trp-rich protein [Verminephrobacter aporrectodeae subsp. tuberculatae]|uniref:TIGR04438 family Trp-rich protein n=1 Tax=Verminephrobacter aporrectodeae TaxID=1110389 RepID=UPI0002375012|nr:TIGR04438 family Trp-rich protein [Verminephrobacter aporrectodeae]MCW5257170.1 TIGR04438 family Trp-rich protein [Verminephrobacter aporrectodeae subsp. tuberculatae]
MPLLGFSLLVLVLKYFEIGPLAAMSWWWVLLPFAITALWWFWADSTDGGKRRIEERIGQRKQDRIDKRKQALGMRPGSRPPPRR